MRERKPVPEFDYITLEGNAKEVQQQGSEIDFMASDITVLAQQPGLGKTHAVIDFCKKNPDKKILYLTTRHRLINEITKGWRKASHWYGFSHLEDGLPKGCPKFLNPRVGRLHKAHLRTSLICSVMGCDKGRCRYRHQFKKYKLVFAPVEYINTSYILDEDGLFKFDICFIDESILKTDELSFDLDGYLKAITAINQKVPFDYVTSFVQERNYDWLQEMMDKVVSDVNTALLQYANSAKYGIINDINKLDINKIIDYGHYDKLYRGKIENCKMFCGSPVYYKPFSYKIFEIAQQVPVVMLDASFEETLFRDHLEFYNYEYGFKKDLKVTIYKSNVQNPKSIIYRMHDTSAHPKVNFTDKTYKEDTMLWVKHDLGLFHDIFGSENVGIIHYKEFLADNIITRRKEFLGFEAMSYGDILGSNSFDGKKVLVVLGTYDIPRKEVVAEIYKHYLLSYPIDSITDAKDMKEAHDKSSGDLKLGPWSLEGEDFSDGYRALWGTLESPLDKLPYMISSAYGPNEIYQALHRSRFLTHDVIIFAYCHLPGKVLAEAGIIELDKDIKGDIFEMHKFQYGKPRTDMVKLGSIVNDMDEGLSSTKICKKYKIRSEDGNLDTKSVSGMKEVLKHYQDNP